MSKERICVLVWTNFGAQQKALASALRDADIELLVPASEAEAIDALPRADVALLPGVDVGYTAAIARAVHAAPRLRWIQLIATGQEGIETHGAPSHVAVTGVGNTSAPVVAEHAMALLLALARRIGESASHTQRGEWSRPAVAAGLRSLEGQVLCLAGYGRIGKEIARRAQAFGMRCIAVNRSGRNDAPELVQQVFTMERLHEALAQSDAIAISLPLTPDTQSLFGASAWATCKRGALVVNVGRGAVIDTDSLVDALHGGQLGGAGLDVTEPEPLPADHPLWRAPGVLITPHVGGGGSPQGFQRLAALILDNLQRFRAGQPLLHTVDPHPARQL